MVEDDDLLDPFSSAENIASLVLDQVLQEGGRLLYDSYIARKSFSFAAEAVCEVLVGEMKMQFVSYDEGEGQQQLVTSLSGCRPATGSKADLQRRAEDDVSGARGAVEALPRPGSAPATTNDRLHSASAAVPTATGTPDNVAHRIADDPAPGSQAVREGWCLESEPTRCRIDTWARACVPVRKVSRHKMVSHNDSRKGHASNGSVSVPSSRSPSRFGAHPVAEGAEAPKSAARNQMIPLVDEREEDEEEVILREMKEREARKYREEQVRTERKAAEEEAAKLVQVKDDKKQFTYDSEGNVIMVQPPQVNRLPNPTPAMTFVCKEDVSQEHRTQADKKIPRVRDKHVKGKRKESVEFKDGFKKFLSQQPSMMEAMAMSPGVELEERSKTKRGEKVKIEKGTMSRKEYEEVARGGAMPSKASMKPAKTPPPVPSALDSKPGSDGIAPPLPDQVAERQQESAEPTRIARSEAGSDLVKAPKAPRPLQPSPPSSSARVQSKRDAMGYSLSARERLRINAGSRFPDCAPQPPLGATMGHGLVPQTSKHQDYYFPGAADTFEEEDIPVPKENIQGLIVSKNAQLKRRLFEGR
ncbi:unnamed protein product [Symbiodinium pilosum]|uniref:Uncharacterized protein n=1 Tax=Symbiodinium pilosum TaxID=2952 RepID=A0A812SG94_SYMPI|nr:unnamed protein product [Symbiodinium pilosum]